jgi:hypothetical protein
MFILEAFMSTTDQEFKLAIISRNINVICIKRFLRVGDSLTLLEYSQIDEIFGRIREKIVSGELMLIIFSESFFGDTKASDNERINYIMEKCRQLTKDFTKIILHLSFLHEFRVDESPIWLQQYNPISAEEIPSRLINTTQHAEFLRANETNQNRIANYSLVIWNGLPITIYRKSTYCEEAEKNVNPVSGVATHAYEFGDFKSHILVTNGIFKQMAEIFASTNSAVITRMCSDMNHRFLNTLPKNRETLLILPANEAPKFEFIGTTLHVDDYIKCNEYITLHDASKIVTVRLISKIQGNVNFLGFCFNISRILDSINNEYCFSNSGDYSIAAF